MLNGAKRVSGKLTEFKSPWNMENVFKIMLLKILQLAKNILKCSIFN